MFVSSLGEREHWRRGVCLWRSRCGDRARVFVVSSVGKSRAISVLAIDIWEEVEVSSSVSLFCSDEYGVSGMVVGDVVRDDSERDCVYAICASVL